MIAKIKAKKVMDEAGLEVCDAILILIGSSDKTGTSRINKGLTKEQSWKIMYDAILSIKEKHGGSYNLKQNFGHKMIGKNILWEFGK